MTRHKRISGIKSIARIVGCMGAAAPNALDGLFWLCAWLAFAEVLGILEEVGEP